jgi:hypothetical protein
LKAALGHVFVSPSQATGNMTMLMITPDGRTLSYDVSGAGVPIVFVAGLGDRGTYWTAQVAAFSSEFQVVTFDHRGVGSSEGQPPHKIEQWAADTLRLIDHLGLDRVHLVGHSTGCVYRKRRPFDLITESLNVGHDGRADILRLEPGCLALQAQEPTRSGECCSQAPGDGAAAQGARSVQFTNGDRLFFIQLYRWCPSVLKAMIILRPETVVRWHRAGLRRYWLWKSRSQGGRPQIPAELRALIWRMSVDNRLWGAPHIHGELLKLGFAVAQSTVGKYKAKRGDPSGQSWGTFLRNHMPQIAAMDLFVVPTIGFVQLYVLVIVRLARRELVWFNVTAHPTAEWSRSN